MGIREEADRIKKKLEESTKLKVRLALFGQPGSGKSSIINKLVGKNVATVGVTTDVTQELKEFEWNGVILGDLPGYDTARFPRETYLEQFKVNDFDLFLCVFSGKFHEADSRFFSELKRIGKVCLFVRNKHDMIWEDGKEIPDLEKAILDDVIKQVNSKEEVIFTSCRNSNGFDILENKINANLEPAKQERWVRTARSYSQEFLDKKHEYCEQTVVMYSAMAVANAFNPIPGLDFGVDLTLLINLFESIRNDYGLSDERIGVIKEKIPALMPLINNVLELTTKEGIKTLLKRYAGRKLRAQLGKYIPLIGQAVSAVIGYQITASAGTGYLEDCHKLASEILKYELGTKK